MMIRTTRNSQPSWTVPEHNTNYQLANSSAIINSTASMALVSIRAMATLLTTVAIYCNGLDNKISSTNHVPFLKITCLLFLVTGAAALPPVIRIGEYR